MCHAQLLHERLDLVGFVCVTPFWIKVKLVLGSATVLPDNIKVNHLLSNFICGFLVTIIFIVITFFKNTFFFKPFISF